MVQAISANEVSRKQRENKSWNTRYLGERGTEVKDEPQAFRVDMAPERIIKPHFHAVDQYQVLYAGSAKLGRDEAALLGIHYVDHHTAYGPIVAGPVGFSYFTLRPQCDSGTIYLDRPDFREHLKPSKKRHRTVTGVPMSIEPVMSAREETSIEPLFDAEADGLVAFMLRAGADKHVICPDPAGSGGQYIFVANGSAVVGGKDYPPQSVIWVSGGDAAAKLTAGPRGVEALVMQFPSRPN